MNEPMDLEVKPVDPMGKDDDPRFNTYTGVEKSMRAMMQQLTNDENLLNHMAASSVGYAFFEIGALMLNSRVLALCAQAHVRDECIRLYNENQEAVAYWLETDPLVKRDPTTMSIDERRELACRQWEIYAVIAPNAAKIGELVPHTGGGPLLK